MASPHVASDVVALVLNLGGPPLDSSPDVLQPVDSRVQGSSDAVHLAPLSPGSAVKSPGSPGNLVGVVRGSVGARLAAKLLAVGSRVAVRGANSVERGLVQVASSRRKVTAQAVGFVVVPGELVVPV